MDDDSGVLNSMKFQGCPFRLWMSKLSAFQQGPVGIWEDESGQDLIEYALIVAFIALGAVTTLKGLATTITNFWNLFLAKMAAAYPS